MEANKPNRYFIDPESPTEMARLMYQDRLLTRNMGGLFSEQSDLSHVGTILDIACGPGGWVLDAAFEYPQAQVIGIDISHSMVRYAQAQASSRGLRNAEFQVMDATKPLAFADHSFDLVNGRLLFGFMPTQMWPLLLQECRRIVRPGGILRLTECEMGITTSAAHEKISAMITRAFYLAGQSFSPEGRAIGITAVLPRLLREAGFQHLELQAHVCDSSFGTAEHNSVYQDNMVAFQLLQPFLITMGVTTSEEIERLYQFTLAEMLQEDYSAIGFYLTAWGITVALAAPQQVFADVC